jgi:hypothetical protein
MRKSSSAALCLGFVFGFASLAHAQATRTFVSGVGDDANPCSRTAPCKTFAGAISKTATGGFINILDSGGFGTLTINKSITVDGDGAHAGVLSSLTTGFIINAAGARVTLRNLSIESPTGANAGVVGINVLNASEVHIENCWIGRFTSHAISFAPSAAGTEGFINDVTAVGNGGSAVSVVNNSRVSVNRLNSYTNDAAVFVRGNSIATVRDSIAVGGSVGFGANTVASAVLNLENVTTTHNGNGILAAAGATVRVSNSMIVSNVTNGINASGGAVIISLSGNSLTGNPNDGVFNSFVVKQ